LAALTGGSDTLHHTGQRRQLQSRPKAGAHPVDLSLSIPMMID